MAGRTFEAIIHDHEDELQKDTQTTLEKLQDAGSPNCSSCALPTCRDEMVGCDLEREIPDFIRFAQFANWPRSFKVLSKQYFHSITGRICPAPCMGSLSRKGCVDNLPPASKAVKIKDFERVTSNIAYLTGMAKPQPPEYLNHYKVAVIGSGPGGLTVAKRLRSFGYDVEVFEREKYAGGLLRFGIPSTKLPDWVIDVELKFMEEEGVKFHTGMEIGKNVQFGDLYNSFDKVILAIGAEKPRPLNVIGEDLPGVHNGVDFLKEHKYAELEEGFQRRIETGGKDVVVVGAGDTGEDCVHVSNLEGAKSVQMLIRKSEEEYLNTKEYPSAYSPEQIGPLEKRFATFIVKIEQERERLKLTLNDGAILEADLVLKATGFTGPDMSNTGLPGDTRQMVRYTISQILKESTLDCFKLTDEKLFLCGDARRGPKTVVQAIADGDRLAHLIAVRDGVLRTEKKAGDRFGKNRFVFEL